ncbi:MAG: hypothetical protein AAGC65_03790 [Mucilaginibacter sp.]|uniref:hypothetical protein n=1 Tax=Mucilaginibacter sp. TaxID=1882438 RepID=UPI0031A69E2E
MKLFYHFLIFVFVSLLLIACANLFTTDREKELNQVPSGSKHSHSSRLDSSVKTDKQNNTPYIITSFNYKNFLKGRRWTDKQCNIIAGLKSHIW